MSFAKAWNREVRVAFSRRAQPVWFRVVKWIVILSAGFLLWGKPYFWIVLLSALTLGLTLHLFWRWKTRGWTRTWGGWDDLASAREDGELP